MICQRCFSSETRVLRTLPLTAFHEIQRHRECPRCGHRFYTSEAPVLAAGARDRRAQNASIEAEYRAENLKNATDATAVILATARQIAADLLAQALDADGDQAPDEPRPDPQDYDSHAEYVNADLAWLGRDPRD